MLGEVDLRLEEEVASTEVQEELQGDEEASVEVRGAPHEAVLVAAASPEAEVQVSHEEPIPSQEAGEGTS